MVKINVFINRINVGVTFTVTVFGMSLTESCSYCWELPHAIDRSDMRML